MICCVECDKQKAPKMEMVGDHEIRGSRTSFLYFLSIFLMFCCFLGYEHWFVVLHGVLMLRSNVGDGACFCDFSVV
jgi:hypothetical protein